MKLRRARNDGNIFMGILRKALEDYSETSPQKNIIIGDKGVLFPNPIWYSAASFLFGEHQETMSYSLNPKTTEMVRTSNNKKTKKADLFFKGDPYYIAGEFSTNSVVELAEIESESWKKIIQKLLDLGIKMPEDTKIKYYCIKEGQEDILCRLGYTLSLDLPIVLDVSEPVSVEKDGAISTYFKVYNGFQHPSFRVFPLFKETDLIFLTEITKEEAQLLAI